MIEDDAGTVRKIEWIELCPWLILLRCFRMAIGFRLLILATVGAVLTVGGWTAILWVFSGDSRIAGLSGDPWSSMIRLVPDTPGLFHIPDGIFEQDGTSPVVNRSADPFLGTWAQLSRPVREVFGFPDLSETDPELQSGWAATFRNMACFLLCGLWGLAVWAFFGGAITRSAAVELARQERIGLGQMLGFARARWLSFVGAPLLPLVVALAIACAIGILGMALRLDLTRVLLAIIWPMLLLGGGLMTMLLLGLLFGWPLMFAATSVEGADAIDAVSHSYAHTFQRPWQYLFYVGVAVVLGALGWLVVSNVAAATIGFTYWAASLGGGPAAVGEIIGGNSADVTDSLGGQLIRFWCGCTKLLAVGFLYSYFWTASTAIYLLLRLDNDQKEMDEVFMDDDEDEPPYALPPLTTDAAGAPVAADEVDAQQEQ